MWEAIAIVFLCFASFICGVVYAKQKYIELGVIVESDGARYRVTKIEE